MNIQNQFQQALALHQAGRLADARVLYKDLLNKAPNDPDLLRLLGMAECRLGNSTEGVSLLEKSLQISPNPATFNNYGLHLLSLNRPAEAMEKFDRALALKPDYVVALNNRGNALAALERPAEAVACYDRAIALDAGNADAHYNRGVALHDLKRFDEAIASFDRALAIVPNAPEILINRGIALQELEKFDEALESYERAIALNPAHAEAYGNRGNVFNELERYEEAQSSFERAIELKPDYAEAYNSWGNTLAKLEQFDAALAKYEKAIALKPGYAEAYNNCGTALAMLEQFDAALARYEQAIALKPDFAEAYNKCGGILLKQKRYEAALVCFEKAIDIDPDHADAYIRRGDTLVQMKQYQAALSSFDQAIALKPDYAEAYFSRGNANIKLKQYDAAIASFEQAYLLKPDTELLLGSMAYGRMQICDWSRLDEELPALLERIGHGEKAVQPFGALSLTADLATQQKVAELYGERYPEKSDLGPIPRHGRKKKVRIGYFSGDFRDHPVSILTAELFELHDKSRYELIGFSFGQENHGELKRRIKKSFNKFFELEEKTAREVASLSRKMGIDIAVDLGGHTGENASSAAAFAYRAAPVQVSYLGYSGTMGISFYDYILADKILIPPDARPYYSEKVAYLPNSYMANDRKREISGRQFTREEMGLPDSGFVFCCFNNSYKISPGVFDVWMRILRQVEGSVLWLSEVNDQVAGNLRKEAAKRGVDADKLIFTKRLPSLADHLARHRLADLFLDTLPYNAHTTSADALWAGLPVLTRTGASFASRVAASLLNALDLPELVTEDEKSYETLAVELALNPEKLSRIRRKLEENRLVKPLFDTPLFARHMEAAYEAMFERYLAGLPPEHIHVEQ